MAVVIDGGLSTELERIGATFEGPLWTGRTLLDQPELIEQAHRNYVDAGAEVIITSSYQVSRQGFVAIGLSEADADGALRSSVDTARAAVRGTSALVAASIGPYGAILHDGSEYRGGYGLNEEELRRFHVERITILEEAGPDVHLAETIPDLVEVRALARALEDVDRPVWISFSASDGAHLPSGASIEEAIETVSSIPRLEVIGFNCVQPEIVSDLVTRARSMTSVGIAVYPNKGGSWDPETGDWSDQGVKALDEWWNEWSTLEIDYVGGCCGTHALDITRLSQQVRESASSR
jgi:homocysteine S-methyltransferase